MIWGGGGEYGYRALSSGGRAAAPHTVFSDDQVGQIRNPEMCRLWRGYKFLPNPARLMSQFAGDCRAKSLQMLSVIYRSKASDLELTRGCCIS